MSLRWRRRTRGRKHHADAVVGALREEVQEILAWRRRLPTDIRARALGIVVEMLDFSHRWKCRNDVETLGEDARRLTFYVRWQEEEQSVSVGANARGARHNQWAEWELLVEVPASAMQFVLAALREEQDKP